MTTARATRARRVPVPAPDTDLGADEVVAAEGWTVRARQFVRTRALAAPARARRALLAAACVAIDGAIARLQRLRKLERQTTEPGGKPPRMNPSRQNRGDACVAY